MLTRCCRDGVGTGDGGGYFQFCGAGGDGGGIGLSIMADIDHNCMKQCDSLEMCIVSLLMCPGELAEAYLG